jgi:MFS family permease
MSLVIEKLKSEDGEKPDVCCEASVKSYEALSSLSEVSDLDNNEDSVMTMKMKLINNALDQIGFTPYHLKLFFLNGMGYATDSQLTFIESNVRQFVNAQFGYKFPVSNIMLYGGMLAGSLFWGLSGDLIGRRLAFNLSLMTSAIFTIMGGMMGTFATYNLFVFLGAFSAGGNLVLDTCVFLEFLAHKDQWLLTFFALFWGVGQTVAVLLAFAFLPNHSCTVDENTTPQSCPSHENKGWRYVYYTNGAIVLVLAILRLTVVRLKETPKFLVSNNRDEEAVANLQSIAQKYGRNCDLTVEDLKKCGNITSNHDYRDDRTLSGTVKLVWCHIKILFSNRKIGRSTGLLFASWLMLGIAYPLYISFLPQYLKQRGGQIDATDTYGVYRDNIISNVVSISGPIMAGGMLYYIPALGRRGVMCIGGITSMAFFFGYTAVRTRTQNVALSSVSFATIYIYFSVLYAYSPEVLPSSARATGNALCIALTRVSGCMVALIGYYGDPTTSVPIWICGALVGVIGLMALFFPFEPSKQRVL